MHHNAFLRNQTIYQLDVRNYTKEGTFKALSADFPRLFALGIKTVYLLPIHPIGVLARKGTLGSPYSIQNYRKINPSLGNEEDFAMMIHEAHAYGLKIMLDIVYNHTSRDADYVKEHPEWYVYKDGHLANRIGDWSDVADLDFSHADLQDYLAETLVFWAQKGVDGFRCDVASIVPLSFWKKAQAAVRAVSPKVIWLAESVDPGFIRYLRGQGYEAYSDAELYQVFDILYDYDVFADLVRYLDGKGTLDTYLTKVAFQEYAYPAGYVKLHFLENHDQDRIASRVHSDNILRNLTAWSFFQNGSAFLYAGQEMKCRHHTSIFDKDPVDLRIKDSSFYDFIKQLIDIKTIQLFFIATRFDILPTSHPDLIYAQLSKEDNVLYGVFNLTARTRSVHLDLPDGEYVNLIDGSYVRVKAHHLTLRGPLIIRRIR